MDTIRVMITGGCPQNCSYCFVKTSPGYEDFLALGKNIDAVIKQTLVVTAQENPRAVEIIGGEPFTCPQDIDKLLYALGGSGVRVISFFTSATTGVDDVIEVCKKHPEFEYSFYVSYDGGFSVRNRDNRFEVKAAVQRLRAEFKNVGFRWSVNIPDIPHLYKHFLEIIDAGIENPLFFPMKYQDYTDLDIEIFDAQFQRVLEECMLRGIPYLNLTFNANTYVLGSSKKAFVCPGELTVLPDGSLTNCYVLYSSSGYMEDLRFPDLQSFKTPEVYLEHEHCHECLDVFGSCNKCPGNLIQYQRMTGNEFWGSYCKLINTLSLTFLKTYLRLNPYAEVVGQFQGKTFVTFRNSGGKIVETRVTTREVRYIQ